ncbi:16S rRNA (guanine(966)-N(2))-methyltransferase RsmD [Planctomyces sp. SH-PL62]|uniref:16S rRNA (guanine(966)-N(2))-methyltransferase RsmD n=1 Tax=Planctomyces sp. SH-PL62 TaxID=1636152 RepID=UPI00078EEDE5|nr:16S rRNA (guanine(966)-N(2))-methyltransferase RsmD [Planctomyces sp. SH-PL62]AMV38459.1 Ribosomal RNA small subunit methyltransferase D [Planctomyces sp. SH-PL62]
MRIIAGQRRGHKIEGPRATAAMRPTSDLVRESLFNIVGAMMPGRTAVDLFAGTGAIGLEALSRGAESAIFVEKDREAVALIHANVAKLRYQDRAQIRLADAYRWVRTHAAELVGPTAVFLDPPYREYEIGVKRIRAVLDQLVEQLPAGSLIVLEAGRILDDQILPDFDAWDVRRYGDTQVAVWLRDEPDANEAAGDEPRSEPEAEGGEEPGEEVGDG